MDEQLRANICGLKFPESYLDNDEIQHLVAGRISSELKYACLHWATHLFNAEKDLRTARNIFIYTFITLA